MSEARIIVPERGYFSLPRNAAQDERLTLASRGLLALMLSLPKDWDYTISGLAYKAGCGRDKMRRMIQELEAVGYLVRTQSHGDDGKFGGNVYILQETPTQPSLETDDEPLSEKPYNGDTDTHRCTEKPSTAKPLTVFRPQQIIDKKIRDINIPPIVPQRGKRRKRHIAREAPDWKPERFAGLWTYYPAKGRKNKQDAMNAWDDLKPNDELLATIARALGVLKASEAWQRDIGIPYLATFLRQARWEDAEAERETGTVQAEAAETVERRNLPQWT